MVEIPPLGVQLNKTHPPRIFTAVPIAAALALKGGPAQSAEGVGPDRSAANQRLALAEGIGCSEPYCKILISRISFSDGSTHPLAALQSPSRCARSLSKTLTKAARQNGPSLEGGGAAGATCRPVEGDKSAEGSLVQFGGVKDHLFARGLGLANCSFEAEASRSSPRRTRNSRARWRPRAG